MSYHKLYSVLTDEFSDALELIVEHNNRCDGHLGRVSDIDSSCMMLECKSCGAYVNMEVEGNMMVSGELPQVVETWDDEEWWDITLREEQYRAVL